MNQPVGHREETYLCFSLVVKREDVVSPPRLTLSDQKHAVSLRAGALNQVGGLDAGDGPVEPRVGEQEVIGFLGNLLGQGERGGAWLDRQSSNGVISDPYGRRGIK